MKNLKIKIKNSNSGGFTIIETIVYLALFTIIIGGSFTAAYGVAESNSRNQTKAQVQEEGDFLIGKINWALSGTQSVSSPAIISPATSAADSTLSVAKWDTTIGNPVVISLDSIGNSMLLSRGGNPSKILNNSNVQISNLTFIHFNESGDGIDPERVESSFTVTARTATGAIISRVFSTTNYLRR